MAATLAPAACKKPADRDSKAPYGSLEQWTLAEIEAELDRNGSALESEGIMVASIDPGLAGATATPTDEAVHEQVEAESEDDGDGAAIDYEPEPEPSPELAESYDEPVAASAPSMDRMEAEAPGEGRRSRRRRASRGDRRQSTRCTRVCDLAEATCELEAQICSLAEEHTGEPRYTRACLRAEQQCIAAARHCDRCED